jgi:hypothetical protein
MAGYTANCAFNFYSALHPTDIPTNFCSHAVYLNVCVCSPRNLTATICMISLPLLHLKYYVINLPSPIILKFLTGSVRNYNPMLYCCHQSQLMTLPCSMTTMHAVEVLSCFCSIRDRERGWVGGEGGGRKNGMNVWSSPHAALNITLWHCTGDWRQLLPLITLVLHTGITVSVLYTLTILCTGKRPWYTLVHTVNQP